MEDRAVDIIVDSREKSAGDSRRVEEYLKTWPNVTIIRAELESGDYAFNDVLVERKAGSDFAASILDQRFFSQIDRMKALCNRPVVLVEGSPYKVVSALERKSIDGAISWLAMVAGVQLVFAGNAEHSAALIYRMAVHATHGLGYTPPYRSNKPKLKSVMQRYLLEGLPGIGGETANKLLDHFGSALAVFNATESELAKVKGIGPSTIKKIKETLL